MGPPRIFVLFGKFMLLRYGVRGGVCRLVNVRGEMDFDYFNYIYIGLVVLCGYAFSRFNVGILLSVLLSLVCFVVFVFVAMKRRGFDPFSSPGMVFMAICAGVLPSLVVREVFLREKNKKPPSGADMD